MRARGLRRERFDCQSHFHWAQRQGLVQRHSPIVVERSSCNVSSLHSYLPLLKLYAKTDVMPMANSTRTTRFRFWLWLIRVIGVIVPRRLRADWQQEWEAELRRREELLAKWDRLDWRNKLDLRRRSGAAFWDALWLQPKRLEDEMFQDLRFGLRMLRTSKTLTLVAVLSIGLGVGATSAIYALVDQLLIHNVTAREPERLVTFTHGPWSSYLNFRDIRSSGVLAQLAADTGCYPKPRWREGDRTYAIAARCVSGNFFEVMGWQAALGRVFTDDEAAAEKNPRVVVISHEFWRRRLAGDPNVIGRILTLNQTAYTIIGVLPADIRGNYGQVIAPVSVDLYPRLFERDSATMGLTARLLPDRTPEQTQQALMAVMRGLAEQYPDKIKLDQGSPPKLRPVLGLVGFGKGSWELEFSATLGAVAALILLLACANVAGLLLARGVTRRREIAIRLAVGATRFRLIR